METFEKRFLLSNLGACSIGPRGKTGTRPADRTGVESLLKKMNIEHRTSNIEC